MYVSGRLTDALSPTREQVLFPERTSPMAHYLVQLAYTPEAWAAQLKKPQSRVEVVRPLLERLGAHFETTYMSFGDYDVIFIMEAPDNLSAAGIGMTIMAGGAVRAYKTTPLLSIEDGIAAMQKGAEAAGSYRPPA
jgi:uncharacterized protein with GYD domain